MGLRKLSWRHLSRPDRSGLGQFRCEPNSDDARWRSSCGAYVRVCSLWNRTLVHVPYGDNARCAFWCACADTSAVPSSRSWSEGLVAEAAGNGLFVLLQCFSVWLSHVFSGIIAAPC